jgi:CheY-like chemotaxis protein
MRLDRPQRSELITVAWGRALYAFVFAAVLALLVIDVANISDWTVDNTTIALVALLALLPLVGRIRSARLGTDGVSVEMFERVQQDLRAVEEQAKRNAVGVARASELAGMLSGTDDDPLMLDELTEVDKLVDDVVDEPDDDLVDEETARPPSPIPPRRRDSRPRRHAASVHAMADAAASTPQTRPRSALIERIVWVDDDPDGNALYREELARRWEVVTATSTHAGRALVEQDPGRTLVITDAVREEDGRTNREAGLELLAWLRGRHPDVPAVVFAGPVTVREHADALGAAGATVTADFGALLATLVQIDRRRLVTHAVELLREAGFTLLDEPWGADLLARRPDGRKVAIEVKAWQHMLQVHLLDAAIRHLAAAMREVRAEEGLLIVRGALPSVTAERQRAAAAQGLHLVSIDELERWLRD